MRRKDREITDPIVIEAVLRKARVMHLGLSDEGAPYVVPMHYGYTFEDGKLKIFAHGAKEGRKYDILAKNNRVCVEIDTDEELVPSTDGTACAWGAKFASIIAFGTARVLEDIDEKREGLLTLMKTQTGQDYEMPDASVARVNVLRIDVETYSCKAKYDGR